MIHPRLNRLFASDNRAVILGFDHGVFGERSWLPALHDLRRVIAEHVAEGPDGMTLGLSSAPFLQAIPGPHKPALVVRADLTNAWLAERPDEMFCHPLPGAVHRAVALDATCVVVAVMDFPGNPELYRECLRNVESVRAACDPVGMPLMVEVMTMTVNDGVPRVVTDVSPTATLTRQAAELGAAIVKADPSEPVEHFADVVEAANGLPVLASGGVKASDEEILHRTAGLVSAGAAGVVYGRNVMWAEDPPAMTRALMSVVHGNLPAAEAFGEMHCASASHSMDGGI